ncbi:MAG: hypothetical protein Fur0018_08220 [Anaerolineales bacterium]
MNSSSHTGRLDRLLARWRAEPEIGGNICTWHTTPPQAALTTPFPPDLHPILQSTLHTQGIAALYTHQVQAWEAAQRGEHVALTTPTASGKSLAYNLPILDALLRDPQAGALYLFPTKALAQDQYHSLRKFISPATTQRLADAEIAIYDGDTPGAARPKIRTQARLLLTNPDMLHYGILAYHTRWEDLLCGLRFVVIDEIHIYRGVFGSHVANILRRLQRVARFYGASPQFLLTSATIGNPQAHAETLVGAPVHLIAESGAPRGKRHFLLYNPPIVNEALGLRRSALSESARLAKELLAAGLQTLAFTRSRRGAELLAREIQPPLSSSPSPLTPPPKEEGGQVSPYHSNYLPAERRAIERDLREGRLRLVAATNALELGIDIGGMQAVLMAGYPGSVAATHQQAGRAGRGADTSLAVLTASANPLDQYLIRHPEYLFENSPEHALIDPDHPVILLEHLQCAAYELPLEAAEGFGSLSPQETRPYLDYLTQTGVLYASNGRFFWAAEGYPAAQVSLRNASPQRVSLYEGERLLARVDAASAPAFVHPGAVYLHAARPYLVRSLDLENARANLHPADDIPYFTRPLRQTRVELVELQETVPLSGGVRSRGDLRITEQVMGFRQISWETGQSIGDFPLEMPPQEMLTQGFWIALSEETVKRLSDAGVWNSAPNEYGASWPRQRERARARDGYRCQVCGAPEGERAHHVHHKRPFRLFAAPAEANRLENLVTLCPACHRRVEQAVRVRSGLAGLGYLLHNLAPLLLMCDPTDLGRHSDPKSPLGDGQPVVLLYENIPGGLGFSAQLFERQAELLRMARQRLAECTCSDGCPSCTGPGGEEGSGGRRETAALVEALLG